MLENNPVLRKRKQPRWCSQRLSHFVFQFFFVVLESRKMCEFIWHQKGLHVALWNRLRSEKRLWLSNAGTIIITSCCNADIKGVKSETLLVVFILGHGLRHKSPFYVIKEWAISSFQFFIIYSIIPIHHLNWICRCVILFYIFLSFIENSFYSSNVRLLVISEILHKNRKQLLVRHSVLFSLKCSKSHPVFVSWPSSLEPSLQARLLTLNGCIIRFIFAISFCVQCSVKGHGIIYSHYKAVVRMALLMMCF